MIQRVVRNNTRKSSLFKIQAEKNRFEDHMTQFGLCRLFQLFPECIKEKEFLKDLTQTFVKYSFEASKRSPFFKGMNYNGRQIGFSESGNVVHYRQWLPNAREAYLIGSFNDKKYTLEQTQDGFFQLTIQQQGQIKIMQGAKIQLLIIDKDGKQLKIAPPSSRIVGYDSTTKQFYGICRQSQPQSFQTLETNNIVAYQIDLHQIELTQVKALIPQIQQCKFNTVVFKNLFDFKDKSITPSLLNRFSIKLSYQQVDLLQDVIQRLKSQNIFVLFELNFDNQEYKNLSSIEEFFYSDNGFAFDLKNQFVTTFVLSFFSSHLKQYKVDGYKIANLQKLMLPKDKWKSYIDENADTTQFISDCTRETLLFVKMLIMLIRRSCNQSISYSTSCCKIPGLNLPLQDGGFGFSFSSVISKQTVFSSIIERVKNNYFNTQIISSNVQNSILTATTFLSKSGVIYTNQNLFQSNNEIFCKQPQVLKQLHYFRSQSDYFSDEPFDITFKDQLLVFQRSKFSFVYNYGSTSTAYSVKTQTGSIKYNSSNESIISERKNGIFEIIVPQQSVVVIERQTQSE